MSELLMNLAYNRLGGYMGNGHCTADQIEGISFYQRKGWGRIRLQPHQLNFNIGIDCRLKKFKYFIEKNHCNNVSKL